MARRTFSTYHESAKSGAVAISSGMTVSPNTAPRRAPPRDTVQESVPSLRATSPSSGPSARTSGGTPTVDGCNAPYSTPAVAMPTNRPTSASRVYHARLMATSARTTENAPACRFSSGMSGDIRSHTVTTHRTCRNYTASAPGARSRADERCRQSRSLALPTPGMATAASKRLIATDSDSTKAR